MAGLEELYSHIPTADIASQLGADQGEVENAIHSLVPVLLTGMHQNAQDPEHASRLESAAGDHARLAESGAEVDENAGHDAVSSLFGGNNTDHVASALAGGGLGNSLLLKRLLPLVLPMVLAYVGKQITSRGVGGAMPHPQAAGAGGGAAEAAQGGEAAAAGAAHGGGGLGDILGNILGGGAGANASPGGILGNVLGSQKGGGLGEILGGLLGGKR